MIDDKQPMDLGIPHDTPIFRQPPLFVNARCRRSSQLGAGPCNCFPTQEFQEPIDQLRRPCRLHRSKEMVGSCEKNMGSDRLQWKKTHLTWCHMAKVVGPLVFIIALSICIHIYIYNLYTPQFLPVPPQRHDVPGLGSSSKALSDHSTVRAGRGRSSEPFGSLTWRCSSVGFTQCHNWVYLW